VPGTRRYSTARRDEAAARSRRQIIAAADAAFLAGGYGGTTLSGVAAAAGVSVQTVYNLVGGKPALLKTVYDVRVAGDDEPIAIADRPEVRAIVAATDARSALAAYASLGRTLGERTVPLLARLLPQAAGDPELRAFAEMIERERAVGAGSVARHIAERFGLRPGLTVDEAGDVLWTLTAPELADRLVHRRDWGWDRFEAWLTTTLTETLAGAQG
jgi:AcrR family transcriptional regulator